jgi:cobalt/nickel transport system permease protein
MHLHFLDPYRDRPSTIHTLDPRVKFVFTLAFVLTMALLPVGAWPVYVLMLTVSLSITVLSELGLKYVLKRSLLAIPFVLPQCPALHCADLRCSPS